MIIKKLDTFIQKYTLPILIIYGLIIRLVIFMNYSDDGIFKDSQNYIDLATAISDFNLNGYTGERTPGFPTLIALCANSLKLTILFQSFLGILNIILLYKYAYLRTKNKITSFWIAFITTSFLNFLFFELAILTETLTVTLMLLIFWYIENFKLLDNDSKPKHLFILSLLFASIYLTRPMFIYLPIGFFLFYIVKNASFGIKKTFLKAIIVLIIPFISFYSWCSLNERNIGYFTSTYYLGINLSQTATFFFEKAPEKDKVIRDIFVKHRTYLEEQNQSGKYAMTVWHAYKELLKETKLSPPDLSHELSKISIDLFKKHPDLYVKQVAISWVNFWRSTSALLWHTSSFKSPLANTIFSALWNYVQKPLLLLSNFLFLLFSLIKIITFKFKKFDSDLFLIAIVLSGSLAQALVAYGTNSRFCFPFFPLIIFFTITNITNLKNRLGYNKIL
ncbi:hypothetical protein FG167_10060 [Lacinutrix sp. WUR7]|uniref:hypothetical protein n=1 Tax=Lacinutrix sp. WUR7 TaxID=2653681 RepID=UPI00193D32C8|nr:hypothetical protein [Lacinutrix sp. WUR7]QRM89559.1 hypothetical protein FG167_10060 [Lacinutrix sp. WUR7]